MGRYFYALIHLVMPPDYSVDRISDLDEMRRQIGNAFKDIEHKLVLDTIFTADEKWVLGLVENGD